MKSGNSGNGGIKSVDEEGFDAYAENERFLAGSVALPPIGIDLDHEVGVAVDNGEDARANLAEMGGEVRGFEPIGEVKEVLCERSEDRSGCWIVAEIGLDLWGEWEEKGSEYRPGF